MHEIVIATRGSALALWQANAVASMLRSRHPALDVRLEVITTTGDRNLETPLSTIGDKGLFTKELETALLAGHAHCAVHSLKDMQTQLPAGLVLGAVTRRHAAEDALVAAVGTTLGSLPHGALVATGSLRRTAQLRALRPDLGIVDVRGNIGTRIEKYHAGNWAGMLLARAGLERLGMEAEIAEVIDASVIVPAVGQGALGIECRAGDAAVLELLAAIEHQETRAATAAERAMLRVLEGGCQVPVGGHATIENGMLRLDGVIASLDGTRLVRDTMHGNAAEAESIGERLAARLLDAGGAVILQGIRG
ncbi:MAG: hydroxymethylbilane synthase [Bacteroidetes bacterium]|nr:hydroxymethylbilane synthase [Bacteroidota bacterium]